MGRIDEGLLYDLLTKRRAGQFTGEELLWAADHSAIIRWAMANLATAEGLRKGDLIVVNRGPLVISYDQSLGLIPLIHRAVGSGNIRNVNPDITPERFPLAGTGTRKVNGRVEAYLDGETPEQAAKRLTDAGHILGSTGDLAGFLHDHPDEVEKWNWVDAIAEDSRWTDPDGDVCVPCAYVDGADRGFGLIGFRARRHSVNGILVLCESSGT